LNTSVDNVGNLISIAIFIELFPVLNLMWLWNQYFLVMCKLWRDIIVFIVFFGKS